jgi:peptidoglycan/LPS O-acetylase OafA/YrhL
VLRIESEYATEAVASAEATRDRNFGLDLLRAVAIVGVVLFHISPSLGFPAPLGALAARGWMGVDLFFVLSGYLIGLQIFSADRRNGGPFWVQCSTFWVKRWTRTIPLYVVVLFTYVVLKPLLFHAPFAGGFSWPWLVFLQNYGVIRDFGQSWSLCIEEQFYFFFPVIVFAVARLPRVIWILPMLLSIAIRFSLALRLSDSATGSVGLTPDDYLAIFRFSTPAMLDAISVGVFLASSREIWSVWRTSTRTALAPVGGLIVLLTGVFLPEFPVKPPQIALMYAALAVGFGALLVAAEQRHEMVRGLSFVRLIAMWSYSVYLWHELFTRVFGRYMRGQHWALQAAGYFGVVFGFSALSYQWIEKPGLRLRSRIFRPARTQ